MLLTRLILPLKILLFYYLLCSQAFAEKAALIIVDMQPEFTVRSGYHKTKENRVKVKAALERQMQLIREAKKTNTPIIVVEYEYESNKGKKYITHPWLRREIGDYKKATTFLKKTDGIFPSMDNAYSIQIKNHLDDLEITDLIYSGANGGACVQACIMGSLTREYRVHTDPKAVIDLNSRSFIYPYHYESSLFAYAMRTNGDYVYRKGFNQFISDSDSIRIFEDTDKYLAELKLLKEKKGNCLKSILGSQLLF